MNWFKVRVGISRHPKVFALAQELGVSSRDAFWYVMLMLEWAATLDQEEVDLPFNHAASAIAAVVGYVGNPRDLCNSLVRSGWLDLFGERVRLHGWRELNGSAIAEAKSARERMRALRSSQNSSPNRSPPRTNEDNYYPPKPPQGGIRKRARSANGHTPPGLLKVDRQHLDLEACSQCGTRHDVRREWGGTQLEEATCSKCRRAWAVDNVSTLSQSERAWWGIAPIRAL